MTGQTGCLVTVSAMSSVYEHLQTQIKSCSKITLAEQECELYMEEL